MILLLLCLIVLLVLGGAERLARDRAWRDVPIRVHVNGTRAKSSVTRLVWAALREAGIPAAAKTTGTAPRVLWPDGREEPLARRGAANVREQLAFLRAARRHGARAVVVECMALDPALQRVTERDMVRATVGVITNVRFDHAEVMGADLETIANVLANTIPLRGVLVTGAVEMAPVFRRRAAALGTRVVTVAARGDPVAENEAVAMAVTRELGIDDAIARRAFARAPQDPGSVKRGTLDLAGGGATWIDATAANDPESLALLLETDAGWTGCPASRVLIYNHRADRAPRLEAFAALCGEFLRVERLVITGSRPPWTLRRRLARLARREPAAFIPAPRLAEWIRANAAGAAVAFCGNTRGIDVPRLLEEAATGD